MTDILNEKKELTLTGERCLLKTFLQEDITKTYLSWLNDKDLMSYSDQKFVSHTKESAALYLASFECSQNLFFKIILKESGEFVGTLTVYHDKNHGVADIGILIGSKASQGKGIGLDAWVTCVNWLKNILKVRKITAGALRSNKKMIKIIERSGFVLEACREGQALLDGKPEDILYFRHE